MYTESIKTVSSIQYLDLTGIKKNIKRRNYDYMRSFGDNWHCTGALENI